MENIYPNTDMHDLDSPKSCFEMTNPITDNDDSDAKLIKLYFKQNKLNISDNIQKLICNDYLYFEKIIFSK